MQHFIASYGYLAIFLLMAAESACIPIPSELIMTFGGALAAGAIPGSRLNLAGVIIAGVAGNVAGSYIAWAVGRYGGQPALHRWGRRIRLSEHELDRASRWFDRHGAKAVLIGRLLPVVRTFISLPAGLAGMAPLRFGIYTTLGCIPWTAGLAYAGYAVGANWESIVSGFHGPTYVIAGIVVIAAAIAVWRYLRRRPAQDAPQPGHGGEPHRPGEYPPPGGRLDDRRRPDGRQPGDGQSGNGQSGNGQPGDRQPGDRQLGDGQLDGRQPGNRQSSGRASR